MRNEYLLAGAVALLAAAALTLEAHEDSFGYVKGAQVEPKGEWEVTQWTTARIGKETGRYLGMDFRTEVEYGVTDRLQAALYLNSNHHFLNQAAGGREAFDDRNRFGVNGASLEFKYQVWSPETHPVGLALYFEPAYKTVKSTSGRRFQGIETETRIILQKNFLQGRLITACNFVIEPEWERTGSKWNPELALEWSGGASWRLRDRWSVGLESRVQTVFPNYKFNAAEFVTLHLGPTVLYSRNNWFASLTVLPQVVGWPDSRGKGGLHLDKQEQLEVRFKIGVEF